MAHVEKGKRYFSAQLNQHGTPVFYYRRPGFPRIQLKAEPGSAAMDRAFYAAEKLTSERAGNKAAGIVETPARKMTICRPSTNPEYIRRFGDTAEPGVERSLRWAVDQFETGHLQTCKPHTRQCYLINLRRVCSMQFEGNAFGDWNIDQMEPKHVARIQRNLASTPATADGTVKHLRAMFYWLKKEKLFRGDNPAAEAQWLHPYNDDNEGWATWERADVDSFMHTHPIGTAAHTALGLILYAGMRITDVGLMTRFQSEKKGGTELHWIESKGRDSTAAGKHRPKNKERKLAIMPELRAILDAAIAKNPDARALVCQDDGQPYSRGSIQKVFKRWCEEAGLNSNLAAHGLRKAAASMIYGETGNEAHLCAVFGWKIGSGMAALYARRFDKQRAQASAFTGLRRAMGAAA